MPQVLASFVLLCVFSSWAFANSSCEEDAHHIQQVAHADQALMRDILRHHGEVKVPAWLRVQLERLQAASPILRQQAPIRLAAYRHPRINAHAADHGVILVTAALWNHVPSLSVDEAAAVLAHELAHIEMRHSLIQAFDAIALIGTPNISVKHALEEMYTELFNSNSDFALAVRRNNHARELSADRRGIELMRLAGYDVSAMSTLLTKMFASSPTDGRALSRGTHPDSEIRLRTVSQAIAQRP